MREELESLLESLKMSRTNLRIKSTIDKLILRQINADMFQIISILHRNSPQEITDFLKTQKTIG